MGVKKTKKAGATGIPAKGCNECQFFFQGSTNCAGCPETIAVRSILGVAGKNTIVVNATSCLEIVSSQYPSTSWGVNYIHGAFENAAAIAGGVSLALEKMGKAGNVIAIAGDGGTVDIGLQALSGMLERGEKVCYICLDNEAYMNCLTRDAWIMTESGLRKITEIRKGDKLYSFDPKTQKLVLRNCAGVYDNGVKEVFEVRTLHHMLKATGNHPFLVVKHKGRGKESELAWKTVEELKKGDEVVVLKGSDKGKNFKFPGIKKVTKNDHFCTDKISGIKSVGREPTLDLQVDESHNFIANGYVVHNTGVQRSGATPLAASTTTSPSGSVIPGNRTWKKPIVEIVAAHHIPYVATASIGYIDDLKAKVAKALRKENQPSFIHVLNPCPLGWRFDTWRTVEMGRLAVETGMWILLEIENGKTRITKPVEKRKPVEEYLQAQGRFAHLFKPENRHIIKQIQERVDREWDRTSKLCSE